jgi:hypothetical protein
MKPISRQFSRNCILKKLLSFLLFEKAFEVLSGKYETRQDLIFLFSAPGLKLESSVPQNSNDVIFYKFYLRNNALLEHNEIQI